MGAALQVRVTTEDPSQGTHGIFFNRGVAGSHAYNTKFSEHRKWHLVSSYGVPVWRNIINPREIPDPEESKHALAWLSRGLEEALLDFISQATGGNFQVRIWLCPSQCCLIPFSFLFWLKDSRRCLRIHPP